MPKIKVKGQTVQTGELGHTNKQTDATKRIISPASRSIIKAVAGKQEQLTERGTVP